MDIARQLSSLPLWLSGFLVVGLPTALAMLCSTVIRREVGLERLKANNEVAGFKFAVLGVIYAVLLGFAVIVVWEKFHDAESSVTQEAGVLEILYRLSDGFDAKSEAAVRGKLDAYANAAIQDDWPAMAHGHLSPVATHAIDALYATVLTAKSNDLRREDLMPETFHQLDLLTQTRRIRSALAEGTVPSVIWGVLIFGAIATIAFTFFFGTVSAKAQLIMTGLLSAVIFVGLLVILSINCPFTGPTSVGSEPIQQVLADFGGGR